MCHGDKRGIRVGESRRVEFDPGGGSCGGESRCGVQKGRVAMALGALGVQGYEGHTVGTGTLCWVAAPQAGSHQCCPCLAALARGALQGLGREGGGDKKMGQRCPALGFTVEEGQVGSGSGRPVPVPAPAKALFGLLAAIAKPNMRRAMHGGGIDIFCDAIALHGTNSVA